MICFELGPWGAGEGFLSKANASERRERQSHVQRNMCGYELEGVKHIKDKSSQQNLSDIIYIYELMNDDSIH